MAKDLLLEIGVEEIPSAYMSKTIEDLKNNAGKNLDEARIKYEIIESYGTPRRLTLYIKGVSETQEDAVIENRGPKKAAAFDDEGNPTKAVQGFARGQNIDIKDLVVKEVSGTEYVFAIKTEKGGLSKDVLPAILANIVHSLAFPKSMRWGYYNTRFARPVRWLLAMYGNENIEFSIENIKSSNYTSGHRFLSSGMLEVADTDSYFKVLEDNYVILDQEKRKNIIWQQIEKTAAEVGGVPYKSEELLEELTYLVEYPTAFMGSFSASYLDVPAEVLTTTMIEHQRYVPVFDPNGNLTNAFIGVRNGTDYSLDIVRAGNERVLKARLEDALFFWNEDTKQPLETMTQKLNNVLFHERLGSIMDKVQRLQKLAVFIGAEYDLSTEKNLERAASLCKADLVSNMVYEFTELQGVMGRYYALKSKEDDEVSQAIYEHYLPRFAGDELPQTETGKVLSLAEKIDNLVGFFAIGIRPSGSQDPYALRRQAMGIVNIILESELKIDLLKILAQAYDGFADIKPDNSKEATVSEVLDFILQRMRGVLLEKGISYDVIDAVLAAPSGDLNNIFNRVKVVQGFKNCPEYEDFMVVFNRSHNLSKKWEKDTFDPDILVDLSEKELYERYIQVKAEAEKFSKEEDYTSVLKTITELRPRLDNFFESVMVMVDDEQLKATRLGLLKSIAKLCSITADFSKIV